MANEEITISELELADSVLGDMVIAVDTTSDTKSVTLSQLKAWLGSSLPTGFILPAVGKISDERFTLLDGKTLARTGTYKAFCNKVIEKVQAGDWFSCTDTEFNADVAAYGQCGRFVITNDYVRIPLITRYIGATVTLSEIGRTYAESLPNIAGTVSNVSGVNKARTVTGAFTSSNYATGVSMGGGQNYKANGDVGFDASLSSSTYQDNAKVNPEHTKFPYYMVVSTEGQQEEIDVDINQVYEDLELKANKDLSNVPNSKGILVETYVNGTEWYRVYSDGWVEQGGRFSSDDKANTTVTFLKQFANTDYTPIVGQQFGLNGQTQYRTFNISTISSDSMVVHNATNGTNTCIWMACGYVANN